MLLGCYSFTDCLIYHPLTVATVVAELHVSKPKDPGKQLSSFQSLANSWKANLSIKEAADHIIAGSDKVQKVSRPRVLLTGFPIQLTALCIIDITQMIPYTFIKTRLEALPADSTLSRLPAPLLAGSIASLMSTSLINPTAVLFRLQVQARCRGQSHSLKTIYGNLRNMQGGPLRVLFRGTGVNILTAAPAQAIGRQVSTLVLRTIMSNSLK